MVNIFDLILDSGYRTAVYMISLNHNLSGLMPENQASIYCIFLFIETK